MALSRRVFTSIAFLTFLCGPIVAQRSLNTTAAKNHIGETATVCGDVVSTHYAASTRGRPTFLNLDKPYPDQIFTIVIWGSERTKFGTPEIEFKDKRVCVTGTIRSYRGSPEIIVDSPKQIRVESK